MSVPPENDEKQPQSHQCADHPGLDSDRGCAFLIAAAELPAGHAGLDVIRRHKAAVRAKFAELIREDAPRAADPERLAEQIFLLLEGAVAHTGIDGDSHRVGLAREIAETPARREPLRARPAYAMNGGVSG